MERHRWPYLLAIIAAADEKLVQFDGKDTVRLCRRRR